MNTRGLLLFDIDGVIRDVEKSYRLAIQETVNHFCGWKPTINSIDQLKSEGIWNNDWHASMQLIKSHYQNNKHLSLIPNMNELIKIFDKFYFGKRQNSDIEQWDGFIQNESLLVNKSFFNEITNQGFQFGFVSGAEQLSARFVLESRLLLDRPPLIAMGDAPEKPDPTGLLRLSRELMGVPLGEGIPKIGYLGDTVADVLTIKNARKEIPSQKFISFAVCPPHLQKKDQVSARLNYEEKLIQAGADEILSSTKEILSKLSAW